MAATHVTVVIGFGGFAEVIGFESVTNSTLVDRNTLAQLGTAAARREQRKSEDPIWISIGPPNSGVKLGYRAAEAGVWLAALTVEDERFEAMLGPADDENAPPDALNISNAASAAVAWAEKSGPKSPPVCGQARLLPAPES